MATEMDKRLSDFQFQVDSSGRLSAPVIASPQTVLPSYKPKKGEMEIISDASELGTQAAFFCKEMVTSLKHAMANLTKLKPEYFPSDMGIYTSHTHRAKLFSLIKAEAMDPSTQLALFAMAVRIEDVDRMKIWLNGAECSFEVGMKKALQDFVNMHLVQWKKEANNSPTKFCVKNICSSSPPMAALVWKMITPYEERTVGNFLANKWAAQFRFDEEIETAHLWWEQSYWNITIATSNNPDPNVFERGFQARYYKTKQGDRYLLPVVQGTEIVYMKPDDMVRTSYTGPSLVRWLRSSDVEVAICPTDDLSALFEMVSARKAKQEEEDLGK